MKLIYIALIPLIVLSLISVLFGDTFTAIEISYIKYNHIDKDFPTMKILFEIDEITYGISFLVLITAGIVIAGFQVLATGLSDVSVRIILVLVIYVALWTVLSILSLNLLFLNRVIGSVIYIFLSLLYIVGVGKILSE